MTVIGVINDRKEYIGRMWLNDQSEYELYKKLRPFNG
jgi:hypothetical protein